MALFIDDVFIKEHYPIPFAVDATRMRAVINLTQKTFMRDTLGDPLYDEFDRFFEDGEPDDSPLNAIKDDMQMLQALYVAKGMFTSYYKDGDETTRSLNISFIDGNIKLYEATLIRKINSNPALSSIVSQDSANSFNADNGQYGDIFYETTDDESFVPSAGFNEYYTKSQIDEMFKNFSPIDAYTKSESDIMLYSMSEENKQEHNRIIGLVDEINKYIEKLKSATLFSVAK